MFDLYPREARPVNGLSTPSLLIDSDPESDKFISRLTAALSLGNSREQSHGTANDRRTVFPYKVLIGRTV